MHPDHGPQLPTTDWLEPLPLDAETRRRRHTDVSQVLRYDQDNKVGDSECSEAPTRIPKWVLPNETKDALFWAGHRMAPDLIYA